MHALEIIALQLEEDQIHGSENILLADDIQPILENLWERGLDFSVLIDQTDYQQNSDSNQQDQQAIGKTSD